uniref:Uncharacterized protein n=1 Tax=Rhizophora mucronata TaxID=61149 RepID=A0A2P2NCR3_RHIMU
MAIPLIERRDKKKKQLKNIKKNQLGHEPIWNLKFWHAT